jgi:uncharacterized protein
MELWFPYLTAFLAGLLGGVHCVGMCGGIVGAITFGLPREAQSDGLRLFAFHALYNLGRIFSYTLAGALMGGLGALLIQWVPLQQAQQGLLLVAGAFMILLGLYLGGWWKILGRVERLGERVWRRLEPLGRRLLPVRTPGQALGVGALWGWLPCGLVYTMLINAVAAGGALQGAGLLLAFGLGTLPNLLVMGMLVGAAAHLIQSRALHRVAGGLVVLFGVVTLWRAF